MQDTIALNNKLDIISLSDKDINIGIRSLFGQGSNQELLFVLLDV